MGNYQEIGTYGSRRKPEWRYKIYRTSPQKFSIYLVTADEEEFPVKAGISLQTVGAYVSRIKGGEDFIPSGERARSIVRDPGLQEKDFMPSRLSTGARRTSYQPEIFSKMQSGQMASASDTKAERVRRQYQEWYSAGSYDSSKEEMVLQVDPVAGIVVKDGEMYVSTKSNELIPWLRKTTRDLYGRNYLLKPPIEEELGLGSLGVSLSRSVPGSESGQEYAVRRKRELGLGTDDFGVRSQEDEDEEEEMLRSFVSASESVGTGGHDEY